jgi:hypothetical protein
VSGDLHPSAWPNSIKDIDAEQFTVTMKLSLPLKLATLATVALTSLIPYSQAKAVTFDEQELDQSKVIAVARPYGDNKYDLLVIEQIPGKRDCWAESGSNPVVVEPLLLKFDFTGICRRSTDSNGYSIRMEGQDYGLDYLLRVVERNGELVLVGINRLNSSDEIVIGSTQGMSQGFLKIQMNQGWRFTKRTYQAKVLGHFYFSRSQGMNNTSATSTPTSPIPNNGTPVTPNVTNSTNPALLPPSATPANPTSSNSGTTNPANPALLPPSATPANPTSSNSGTTNPANPATLKPSATPANPTSSNSGTTNPANPALLPPSATPANPASSNSGTTNPANPATLKPSATPDKLRRI